MTNLLLSLATATNTGAEQPGGIGLILMQTLPFLLLIVVMYFFMIRPQRKKEKETAQMRSNIQIGDMVTTVGGIVGIVVKKADDTLVIETGGDRSKIRVKLWAIQSNETLHDAAEE